MNKALSFFCLLLMSALMICNSSVSAQTLKASGTVSDDRGPLPGASVVVKGTTNGVITDGNGQFALDAKAGDILQFSFIGYENIEIPAASGMKVTLKMAVEFLEDVVVVGYGVQKKSDVTGAISQVKAQDIGNRTIANVSQAISGKTSGVQVVNTSGRPGATGEIRVRGFSSNSGNISPLFIVDGLQVSDIGYLDPNNIESIEVLKDAASAAIYGAQAGNGVILVTTKSGKSGEGRVFYDMQYAIQSLANVPKFMQAQEYINYMYEGNLISREDIIANYDGHTNTNWADVAFENGIMQRHTVGFTGGNERGNLFTSLTYYNDDGVVRGNKDFYNRLNAQINADYQIKKWLKVGTTNSIEKYRYNAVSEGSEYGSFMASALVMDPLTPAYYTEATLPQFMKDKIIEGKNYLRDDQGRYFSVSMFNRNNDMHPLIARDRTDNTAGGMNVLGTMYADFTPIKGLVVTSKLGYRLGYSNSSSYSYPYYVDDQIFSNAYSLSGTVSNSLYYQWENYATYMFNLGKNSFTAMAGMSYRHSDSNYITGSGDQLRSYEENFRYLSYLLSDCNDSVSGIPSESSSISYFGRLIWNYDNRYMIQGIFRADAFDSSKLAAKNRWGYFPSVSGSWTISNEEFMQDVTKGRYLSYLKLRASWGQNGNIGVLSGYPYTTSISVGSWSYQYDSTGAFSYGSAPYGLSNPDLKWETSEQIDIGLDARFFRDRLSITADWYTKTTKGLLLAVVPPYETGATSVTMNAGRVKNSGFDGEISWRDQVGDFAYSVNANFATLNNRVEELDPTVSRIAGSNMHTSTVTMLEAGHPVWYFYGYKFKDVDDATGNPVFEDLDGDGAITPNDKTDIGNAIPDFTYGITLSAAWKGLDLTIFGSGSQGNDIWLFMTRTDYPKRNRMSFYYDERWTETNTTASRPRPNAVGEENYWYSDANIFDGSYFKIKQIQLGYTLPQKLTKKIFIQNLRLYVSLDNWFTFTKYPGFDPEASSAGSTSGMGLDKGSYPISKKMTFGLNVTF